LSSSVLEHSGGFRFVRASGAWIWAEQTFALLGFAPGEVVPTRELLLTHVHPEDRPAVEGLLDEALSSGRQGSVWHRLVDTRGAVRQVVTLAAADIGHDGEPVGLTGHVLDVTEPLRLTTAREVDEALEQIGESRPLIEQAKGALMVTYGLDADAAFALLRRYSQLRNVKVRDVARALVEAMGREGGLPGEDRSHLDRFALDLRSQELEVNPGA
jgi:ANTAR domain-containing protein/PAS domain-containing protein